MVTGTCEYAQKLDHRECNRLIFISLQNRRDDFFASQASNSSLRISSCPSFGSPNLDRVIKFKIEFSNAVSRAGGVANLTRNAKTSLGRRYAELVSATNTIANFIITFLFEPVTSSRTGLYIQIDHEALIDPNTPLDLSYLLPTKSNPSFLDIVREQVLNVRVALEKLDATASGADSLFYRAYKTYPIEGVEIEDFSLILKSGIDFLDSVLSLFPEEQDNRPVQYEPPTNGRCSVRYKISASGLLTPVGCVKIR